MSRTVVQKIKGHHYLYEVSSEWDPDSGKMKQKRRYIGRCDASGNLNSEKITKIESYEFGQYYLLTEIARRCGVQDALETVLGQKAGRYMTAVSIIRSLRLTSPILVSSILQKSFITRIYDLKYDDEWTNMVPIIRNITLLYDRRGELFPRLLEDGDIEVFELDSFESDFNFLDVIDKNRDGDYGFNTMPKMSVFLAHSKRTHRPSYFLMAPSGVSRTVITARILRETGSTGRCSFFFDAHGIRLKEVVSIVSSGIRATFRTSTDDPLGRKIRACVQEPEEREFVTHIMDGRIYRVCEREVDIDGLGMKMFWIVDEKKRNGEIRTLHSYVDEIINISDFDISDDEKLQMAYNNDFRGALDTISFDHDENGVLRFSLNKDAMFDRERKCGLTVFATVDDIGWEEVLSMSKSRDIYEHDLDVFKTDLEEGSNIFPSTHDGVANFIDDFIAMRIRYELKRMIQESPLRGKMTYLDVLGEMTDLRITRSGGKWVLGDLSDEHKWILEALGIEVPTQKTILRYRGPE